MLDRCIKRERVGDDGREVFGVDRRHDDGPGGVLVASGERERVLEICPRGNNKSIIIIFPCS